MFLRQIIDEFLVRTAPDSSMVKPAHIHITKAPQIRKENVLRMKATSPSAISAAEATVGRSRSNPRVSIPATMILVLDLERPLRATRSM